MMTRPEPDGTSFFAKGDVSFMEPIRRFADHIDLLDQRWLPADVRYLSCVNAGDVIAAIRALAVRGAPAIGVAGSYALWLESLQPSEAPMEQHLRDAAERIKSARPTAVNLAWAVDRAYRMVQNTALANIPSVLKRVADDLLSEETARNDQLARYGAELLSEHSRILTHCNTGSLATPGVGTALGIIREGYRLGLVKEVFVDETRPLLQGARLTAWELQQDEIPATLITDSMAAALMAQGKINAVVVGADRIARNGDTANKIGTYGLAVQAHYHQIPFYVAAPMSTLDPDLDTGSDIPIEERDGDEIRRIQGVLMAPEDIPVYNPAFDVTPGTLISAIITDRGVAHQPYLRSLPALIEQELNSTIMEDDNR